MSVFVDDCDGDHYQLGFEKLRTSHKAHRCTACREPIPAGQPYQYERFDQIGADGHTPDSVLITRRCSRCQAIYRHLCELRETERRAHGHSDWFIAPDLDCGLTYEDEWGDMPPEAQELAFLLPGEQPGALLETGEGDG